MNVNYETATQKLSGRFITPEIGETLPAQYARFRNMEPYLASLGQVRDFAHFDVAYAAAWVGLCMQIDRPKPIDRATKMC